MDNGLKEIRKDALQNGLILGCVLLLLDIIALFVLANSESILVVFLSYLFGYLIIPITAAVILIKRLREKIGGFLKEIAFCRFLPSMTVGWNFCLPYFLCRKLCVYKIYLS